MIILAIETATKTAGCAVAKDGVLLAESVHAGSLVHSQTVMALVSEALENAGVAVGEIDVFAADVGPGSFTGVRIGVATVNALCFALARRAAGVCSLAAMRKGVAGEGEICTMIDARGGRVYAALFDESGGELVPPFAGDVGEFLQKLPQRPIIFAGSGAYEHFERIRGVIPGASLAGSREFSPRSSDVAKLAADVMPVFDELRPLYLQKTQAERMAAGLD